MEIYDSLHRWNVNAVSKGVILVIQCEGDRSSSSSYLSSTDHEDDGAHDHNPLHKGYLNRMGSPEVKGLKWRGRDQFLQLKIGEIRCESGDVLERKVGADVKTPADASLLPSHLPGVEWGYDTDRPRDRPPDVTHVGRGFSSSVATLLLDTGQVD